MPWCVILGNHDLCDNPQAQVHWGRRSIAKRVRYERRFPSQVDYTGVDPYRLWRMPARTYGFSCGGVAFFGLDTSACQEEMQGLDADLARRLDEDIAALGVALAATDTRTPKVRGCANALGGGCASFLELLALGHV